MIPKQAIVLAKQFEGFHRVVQKHPMLAAPYVCPAGYWTIGYGHLCPKDHPPIDEAQGEAYLASDLVTAARGAYALCPNLINETEGRQAAIIDFVFNLGAGRLKVSTLRKRVNENDWAAAAHELRKWVYGGGRKLPGLIARREAEIALL